MFDQKDVEAYRRIKAPEELREQVMRLEQKPEPTRTRTKWISFGSPLPPAQPSCLLPLSLPLLCVGKPPSCIRAYPLGRNRSPFRRTILK